MAGPILGEEIAHASGTAHDRFEHVVESLSVARVVHLDRRLNGQDLSGCVGVVGAIALPGLPAACPEGPATDIGRRPAGPGSSGLRSRSVRLRRTALLLRIRNEGGVLAPRSVGRRPCPRRPGRVTGRPAGRPVGWSWRYAGRTGGRETRVVRAASGVVWREGSLRRVRGEVVVSGAFTRSPDTGAAPLAPFIVRPAGAPHRRSRRSGR